MLKQWLLSGDLTSRGELQNLNLQQSQQAILHINRRARVSQGRNSDQALLHFPQMCSQLAALQAGQHSQDWEFPVIPRSIPTGRACGVSVRLLSESHVAFSCLFSAWDPRCPHKTLPLGILHIPSALQAHQTMVINRRIQPLSTPHIKSETLYHGKILHLFSCPFVFKSRPSTLPPPNSSAKCYAALVLHSFSKSHDRQLVPHIKLFLHPQCPVM